MYEAANYSASQNCPAFYIAQVSVTLLPTDGRFSLFFVQKVPLPFILFT